MRVKFSDKDSEFSRPETGLDYALEKDEEICFDDDKFIYAKDFPSLKDLLDENLIKLALDEIKKRGRQTMISSHISY